MSLLVMVLPSPALAADESTLSIIPQPSKANPEHTAQRQLRRWLASNEPGAGLEIIRLVRTLPDATSPELSYLGFRALAEHNSDPAVVDFLTELAEQPQVRDPGSSVSAQSLTRARALLLLATSNVPRAHALVRDKALGAAGIDPEGRAAARDASWTGALMHGEADVGLPGASTEERVRRTCARDFLANLPTTHEGTDAARKWASDLRTRCLGARKSAPMLELLDGASEKEALAGYRTAPARDRMSWAARVASTVGSRSAPATLLLVQKWLTTGDAELRRAIAWGLSSSSVKGDELGPRIALLSQAIAREERVEARRMLSLAVVSVIRARSDVVAGHDAETSSLTADRTLVAALAQVEPDPVAAALLATKPLVALVLLVERGEFDVELARGLLQLPR